MAQMSQDQIEAWIAANGGSGAVQYGTEQKRMPNPAYNAAKGPTSTNPEYISVQFEVWKNTKTGAVLSGRRGAAGDFEDVESTTADPNKKPADDESTPTARNAAELQRQREKNAALPPGQDPAYETDEERRKRGQETIDRQGKEAKEAQTEAERKAKEAKPTERKTRVNPNDTSKVQELDPATGQWVDAGSNDAEVQRRSKEAKDETDRKAKEKQAEAEKNRPKPVQADDGSWGTWDTSVPGAQPQWVQITGGPAAAMKPVQVNGKWGVWKPGATGTAPSFVEITVPEARQTAKNVDPFNPDFSDPNKDLGLGKWSAAQRAKIGLPADQGGITQAEWDAAVKEAHERAGVSISNLTSANSVIRQQAIDYEAQRHNLSGEADSDFKNAVGMFNSVLLGADPDTGSIRNVIPGMMAEQKKYREERQATAKPMASLHPMFQQAAAESVAKAQPPAATENAAGTGPTPAPYTPPTPPNALGLGAKPGGMTPGAPDAQVAAAAAEAERQQAMAGAPPAFMPPPPISGQSVVPGMGAPGMSPQSVAPPPAPMPPPAPTTPMTTLPAVNPATGEPTGLPQTPTPVDPNGPVPVGQVPGPLTAFAQSVAPPPPPMSSPQQPGTPMNPAIANVAQQAQVRQFDPYSAAGRLASLGVPPEVIAEALKRSGLVGQGSMS